MRQVVANCDGDDDNMEETLMTDETRILTTSAPELVVDLPSQTGEGPLWNQRDRKVYWVDIPP